MNKTSFNIKYHYTLVSYAIDTKQAMFLADRAVARRASIFRLFVFHSWAYAAPLSICDLDSIKRFIYFRIFVNDRFYCQLDILPER